MGAGTTDDTEGTTMPSRILTSIVAGLLLVALASGLAVAKSPHVVDPDSVTPPLNPAFTWDCFEAGAGITCQGTFVNGPYADQLFSCGGQPVFIHGVGYERMTRWHDALGRATKTVVNLDYPEDRLTLAPDGSGPAVTGASHWNRHYTYVVPGDPSSRILTERGAIYLIKGTDGQVILRDVGQVEFAPGADFEDIVRSPGQHDLYGDGFAGFESAVCDELT